MSLAMTATSSELDLSLIIPCYNEEPHLMQGAQALLEVLDQTRLGYEIVFVDDGSRDRTRSVIEQICAEYPRCRYIFHEKNRGRGAAFKTGFAASRGKVAGFLDIDLEVSALYVPALVAQILQHGADIATGYRHYLLRQTGALHRHVLSVAYRAMLKVLIDVGVRDTETGCKFFRRETTTQVVLGSECDGWFWDTEVMARGAMAGLKIVEVPVLFLRRYDKASTVRLVPDTWNYFIELHRFRPKVGLSLANKSPLYWTGLGYDWTMKLLYQGNYGETYKGVAERVSAGSSVVDVCCGTGALYRHGLRERGCEYLGLDFNGHFVMGARKRGIHVRHFNLLAEDIPVADHVVMCSSFYHVRSEAPDVLRRLQAAARKSVIISEPISNLSASLPGVLGRWTGALTNPGVGVFEERFDKATFEAFAREQGASEFHWEVGDRNAIAVFPGRASAALRS